MKRLSILFIAVAVIALAIPAANVSAQTTSKITVSGFAVAPDTLEFLFYAPPPAAPCNVFTTCQEVCKVTVPCPTGQPGVFFLSTFLSEFALNCAPLGLTLAANVSPAGDLEFFITDPSGSIECCIRSGETSGCGPAGESDLNLSPLCSVNNLCNGVACDETAPHVSGLQVTKEPVIPHLSEITITGTATASDVLFFILHGPPGLPCGTFVDCLNTPNACQPIITCAPGDTGPVVAATLAAAINGAGCIGGVVATATGNVLTVSGPVPFECCLATQIETFPCGNGVSLSDGSAFCTVNNVCNGIPCDEILPHVSGLQFNKRLIDVPVEERSWGGIKKVFE